MVLRIDEPQFNHNAGHLAFGPDGYMYIAVGDGGGANDTSPGHGETGNGQNINTIHGSIVRIDPLDPAFTPDSPDLVSANGAYRVPLDNPFIGVDGLDEIYAYGLRNPYRFSFDAHSGALIVADVGQRLVEEINIVNKGHNYGWNLKEGTFKFDPEGVEVGLPLDDPTLTDPVAEYDHDDGIFIIGGHTYYGTEVPELWGRYICGDYSRAFRNPDGRLFVADLFTAIRENRAYVNVHTEKSPAGDIRGQLARAKALAPIGTELSSGPAGSDSEAIGRTVLRVNSNEGSVSYRLDVLGIENVTQAHIHVATEPG
ncbi:MAG: PQQ-dependent sugar dehydrogenase, partial [Sedimentisphaerales bacterium]